MIPRQVRWMVLLMVLGVCSLVLLSSIRGESQLGLERVVVPSPTPSRSNAPSLPQRREVRFEVLGSYPQASPIPRTAVPGVDLDHFEVLRKAEFAVCSDQESISRCSLSPRSEMFCILDRVALNLNQIQFFSPRNPAQPMERIHLQRGSLLLAGCKEPPQLRPHFAKADVQLTSENSDILTALSKPLRRARDHPVECSRWRGGVTFFMTRFVAHNMYHATHEIFSMWMSAHLYGFNSLWGFQIIFLDSAEEDLHGSLFHQTTGLEPISITSLARDEAADRTQCFEQAILGCSSRGLLSLETALASTNTTVLGRSELWLNFRTYMRQVFGKLALKDRRTKSLISRHRNGQYSKRAVLSRSGDIHCSQGLQKDHSREYNSP